MIDDTGFPKKKANTWLEFSASILERSGACINRQVATSLHLAGEQGSGCIGMRLYLPDEWALDFPLKEGRYPG